jgi:hypothetical protein
MHTIEKLLHAIGWPLVILNVVTGSWMVAVCLAFTLAVNAAIR